MLAEVAELHQLEQNVCNRTDEHDDQPDALFWLQCPAQAHDHEDCQNQNGEDYDHSPNCIPESDRTARRLRHHVHMKTISIRELHMKTDQAEATR